MAVAKEDYWVIIAGLGAVGAGYWYWTRNNAANGTSSSLTSTSSSDTAVVDGTTSNANELIQSYDASSVGSTTPNQLYNPGVSVTTPSGYTVNTSSQTFPVGMNT